MELSLELMIIAVVSINISLELFNLAAAIVTLVAGVILDLVLFMLTLTQRVRGRTSQLSDGLVQRGQVFVIHNLMFLSGRAVHVANVALDRADSPILQAFVYLFPVVGYGMLLGLTQVIESKWQHMNGFLMQACLVGLATINMFEQADGKTSKVVGQVFVVLFCCIQALVLLLSLIEFVLPLIKLCLKIRRTKKKSAFVSRMRHFV